MPASPRFRINVVICVRGQRLRPAGRFELPDARDSVSADWKRRRSVAVVELVRVLLPVSVVGQHVRRAELADVPESILGE